MKTWFVIFGSYQGEKYEIDETEDLHDAEYLVGEYQLAYGPGWRVWYERRRN